MGFISIRGRVGACVSRASSSRVLRFVCISQTLGRRSYPGAVSQEERTKGDGGERDTGYQETLGEDGLQRPPQLQDDGTRSHYYFRGLVKEL